MFLKGIAKITKGVVCFIPSVVLDAVTLGGSLTGKEQSYLEDRADDFDEGFDEALED